MSNTNYDDPIDQFIARKAEANEAAGKLEGDDKKPEVPEVNTDDPGQQGKPEEIPATGTENPELVTTTFDINALTPEQKFEVFKSLTNVDSTDPAVVQKFVEAYGKLPEFERISQVYPKVLDELKKKQNIMEYFPDEETFKVVQMMKDPKYKGKESALFTVFGEDVDKMDDLKVITLGATLEKSSKVSNPLRSALKSIGLDADLVTEGEELSDDDRDSLSELADQYREKLKDLRTKVPAPDAPADIEKLLLDLDATSKDDFDKRKKTIEPIAQSIVSELKEIPVMGDFKFVVDINDKDKAGYADFLTHAILSGEYDLNTPAGKEELYDSLLTEVFVDNKEKIFKAYETHLRSRIEAEFRAKYNNEKPLEHKEPAPTSNSQTKNPVMDVVFGMINERL